MKAALRPIDRVFLFCFTGMVLTIVLVFMVSGRSIPEERLPKIAYLGKPLESPEIWLISMDGTTTQQLTHTNGRVYDFSVSPDGENLIYSVLNETGGTDLYRIDRDGKEPVKLVDGGKMHCVRPVWRVDNKLIAYSQFYRGIEVDASIRFIDGESGSRQEIPGNIDLSGANPSFSPDGRYLSFFSYEDSAIHLIDLITGDERRIPTNDPKIATWAIDSTALFFFQSVMNGLIPQSRLFVIDLATMQAAPFLPDELVGYDASPIEWSSNGEWGIFGLTDSDIQSGRQMYIVRRDGQDLQAITMEPGTSHSSYHWSPAGDKVVYQRFRAGALDAAPQVVLWDMKTQSTTVLSENGALPLWLP